MTCLSFSNVIKGGHFRDTDQRRPKLFYCSLNVTSIQRCHSLFQETSSSKVHFLPVILFKALYYWHNTYSLLGTLDTTKTTPFFFLSLSHHSQGPESTTGHYSLLFTWLPDSSTLIAMGPRSYIRSKTYWSLWVKEFLSFAFTNSR